MSRIIVTIVCGLLIGGIASAQEKKLATLAVPSSLPGSRLEAPVARSYDVVVHQPVDLTRFAVKLSAKGRAGVAAASGVNVEAGIITCAHVVEGFSEFTATCDGETATAIVLSVDKPHDLALLSVKWTKPHPVAQIATDGPKPGDTLTSVGRGNDGRLAVHSHTFNGTSNSEHLHSNPLNTGASGSGVFDSSGNVIGIVLGVITSENGVELEPYVGRLAMHTDVEKIASSRKTVAAQNCPDGKCPIPVQVQPQARVRRR